MRIYFPFLLTAIVIPSALPRAEETKITFSQEFAVLKKVDVLIIGGTLSGVRAGLRIKQKGGEVLLVEPTGFLGGGITSSLENILYDIPEGNDLISHLRTKGILMGEIVEPEGLKIALDEICKEKGLPVLFWCSAVDMIVEGNKTKAVVFASKGGLFAVECKVLIDATPFAGATSPFLLGKASFPSVKSIGFVSLEIPQVIPPWCFLIWRNSPWGEEKWGRLLRVEEGSLSPEEVSDREGKMIQEIVETFHPSALGPFLNSIPLRVPPTLRVAYLSETREGAGGGRVFMVDSKKKIKSWESKTVRPRKELFISRQVDNLLFTFGDRLPLQPGIAWLESTRFALEAGDIVGDLAWERLEK